MPQRAPFFFVSFIRLSFNLSTPLQKVVLSLGKILRTLSQKKKLIPDSFLTAIKFQLIAATQECCTQWNQNL